MAFWQKLTGELIDIIEWLDPSNNTMSKRFDRYGNEIKNGAKLTVREGQVAAFVHEGKLADVFEPGMYELTTRNLPILSTLMGWKHGFESPFKSEVYFVSTRQFTDLKWGTRNPVMIRDPEFGPVRLRAFGTYAVKVSDAGAFLREIVGTDGHFTVEEINDQLRNLIVSRFADILGESKTPILDLAANYDEMGRFLTERITEQFADYGVRITTMLVENISLPPAVEEALDKRSSMGMLGNMQTYTQYQTANAIGDAAKNEGPGGMAAGGMGLGMGLAMANQIGQVMVSPNQAQPMGHAAPPPVPTTATYFVAVGGQSTGPVSLPDIQQRVSQQLIDRDTLVWTAGMANWTPAGQTPALSPFFTNAPPPIPGA